MRLGRSLALRNLESRLRLLVIGHWLFVTLSRYRAGIQRPTAVLADETIALKTTHQ